MTLHSPSGTNNKKTKNKYNNNNLLATEHGPMQTAKPLNPQQYDSKESLPHPSYIYVLLVT